jgi:hypothetical protein
MVPTSSSRKSLDSSIQAQHSALYFEIGWKYKFHSEGRLFTIVLWSAFVCFVRTKIVIVRTNTGVVRTITTIVRTKSYVCTYNVTPTFNVGFITRTPQPLSTRINRAVLERLFWLAGCVE